jgi:hypothetical protein
MTPCGLGSTLKLEAISSFENLATTQAQNREDYHPHSDRCENLKFHGWLSSGL